MIEILLTETEKREIRGHCCALCLAQPPFDDGSRCHVHRIVRGCDGGLYTRDNVVALCPPCHRGIDRFAMITGQRKSLLARSARQLRDGLTVAEMEARYRGARVGGQKGGRRTYELHREALRIRSSKTMRALHARLTPAERAANSGKSWKGLTPSERSERVRRTWAKRDRAKRSCQQREYWQRWREAKVVTV